MLTDDYTQCSFATIDESIFALFENIFSQNPYVDNVSKFTATKSRLNTQETRSVDLTRTPILCDNLPRQNLVGNNPYN